MCSLEEEARQVLNPLGVDFDEVWEEHKVLYRHRDEKSIVLGYYFHLPEKWESQEELYENIVEASNPSNSVSEEEANGFFVFLGVGDYGSLLDKFIKTPKMKFFLGCRRGKVYLYGRRALKLYRKNIGRDKKQWEEIRSNK